MGLLDLIGSLGARPSSIYSDFLDAYEQLTRMRHVEENLAVVVRCLAAERAEGQRRCLAYLRAHDADRVVLQLSSTVDVEDFLVALFSAADGTYLAGDFAHAVWRYGPFPRLARTACELCVAHEVFNEALATHLIDALPSGCTEALSGLALLCPVPEYARFFADAGLGTRALDVANMLVAGHSDSSFAVISFLCLYEDITGHALLGSLVVLARNTASGEDGDRLRFLGRLFKHVPAPRLRVMVIAAAADAPCLPAFPPFLVGCAEIDPVLVAGLLSEDLPRVDWCPASVARLFVPAESRCGDEAIAQLAATVTQDPSSVAYRVYKFPLLSLLIENRVGCMQLYLFLGLTDRRTFFSRIHEIVDVCSERERLLETIFNKLLS